MKNFTHNQNGQAALIALITLGIVVIVIGVSIAVRGSIVNVASQRAVNSTGSHFVAQSGIQDGLARITKDKDYDVSRYSDDSTCNGTDTASRTEYLLTVKDPTTTNTVGSTCVEVKKNTPIAGQTQITSRGEQSGNARVLQMVVAVSSTVGASTTLGQITIVSFTEL